MDGSSRWIFRSGKHRKQLRFVVILQQNRRVFHQQKVGPLNVLRAELMLLMPASFVRIFVEPESQLRLRQTGTLFIAMLGIVARR
jgi:hypothetical protein